MVYLYNHSLSGNVIKKLQFPNNYIKQQFCRTLTRKTVSFVTKLTKLSNKARGQQT